MLPTVLLLERMMTLLGSDTVTINNTDRGELHLAKNAFTPGAALVLGDLEDADFDSYGARVFMAGAMPESVDPSTGDAMIDILVDPNTLYETTGVTNLPQTIYGYFITNEGGTVLYASDRLQTNVTLTGNNQSFALPRLTIRLLSNGVL